MGDFDFVSIVLQHLNKLTLLLIVRDRFTVTFILCYFDAIYLI